MLIKSTKLAVPRRPAQTSAEDVAGVVVAVPGKSMFQNNVLGSQGGQFHSGADLERFDPGVYVIPKSNLADSALIGQISGLAKKISIELSSQIHPQLGTGVRAGWIVFGALSLLEQARGGSVPWHKVALKSGELALETWDLASPALPGSVQLAEHWADGLGLLIEATDEAADGNDVGAFVFEKTLDQSAPIEITRQLCSLVAAAQNPQPQFASVFAEPIAVSVESLADKGRLP